MPSRVPKRKTKIAIDGKGSRIIGGAVDPTEEIIGPPPPPPPAPWPPSNAVLVTPSSNLDTLVSVNPAGTTFAIDGGVYNRQALLPVKGGNRYIGNPTNRPIFRGTGINGSAFMAPSVAGGVMENVIAEYFGPYNTTEGGAMVHGLGGGSGWTLTNCEFRWTANTIVNWASGWTMDRCYLHHSGRYAMAGGGLSGTKRFTNGEWSHIRLPGIAGLPQSSDTNSGGCKFAITANIILDTIYVHDIGWNGIWFDIKNENFQINNARIEDVDRSGIFCEVSYGPAWIRNPYIRRSCRVLRSAEAPEYPAPAAILISSTPDVTITNVDIADSWHGVTAIEWAHPQILGTIGTLDATRVGLENLMVDGGTITRIDKWAAGKLLNKQAQTRPGCPTTWQNINFDPGAQFRWLGEYPLTEAQFLDRVPC